MRATVIAVCEKLPAWVEAGFDDYAERIKHVLPLKCIDLALGARGKNADLKRALSDEGARMLAAIPKNTYVIALDGEGRSFSSEALAKQLESWRALGRDLTFLIGGPDGLAPACLNSAPLKISLGAMTLPHALVRIVLAEQLFRAHSILTNHPYHRAGKV
jgi:23S rRNA (pseudouridine1915-N3)-methyltransferase